MDYFYRNHYYRNCNNLDAHVALENLHARTRKRSYSFYCLYNWGRNWYYGIIRSTYAYIIMKQFTLGPNEHIVAIFRKHPLSLWVSGFVHFVLAIIPFGVFPFISSLMISGQLLSIIFWVYLIMLWVSFFIQWTDFMLDTWILTNERLVDIEQKGLFTRRISTLSLDRIQDVTTFESGLIDTFFKIGTVTIQTAGEEREFVIPSARNPQRVKELIMQSYQEDKDKIIQKIADLR